MLISHPVGIGLEVGQGLVSLGGQAADELQAAAGGQQGGDVPGVELGEALGEPVVAVAAEQPGGEGGQLVDVLAGVVEVDDLGGGGEVLAGQVPDLIPVPRLSRRSSALDRCSAVLVIRAGIIRGGHPQHPLDQVRDILDGPGL